MSANFVHVREGYVYQLTEKGKQDPRLFYKYNNPQEARNTQYIVTVPRSWLEKGLVEEVEATK